ncbi:MAG: tetratricopeptide repeat protein, partial [Pseudolabrys sp.]
MADEADPQPNAQGPAGAALQARFEQAALLHWQGRLAEAEPIYREILRQQPNHFDALHLLGVIAVDTQRTREGAELIRKAIALDGNDAFAHNNLGKALLDLKRPAQALACCDRAIELAPDFAMAHNNRGKALLDLARLSEAITSYDRAIALAPDYAAAHSNRGAALSELRRSAEALISYDKAITLEPNNAVARYNRGKALDNLKRYGESLLAYEKAYALQPDLIGAEGDRLHAKMRICDWRDVDADCAHLIASVRNGKPNAGPFVPITIPSSSGDQLQCAKVWIANTLPAIDRPAWQGERYLHGRIRVAYLSSDFHEHATAFLIAGMFESHDKSKFETTAISWGPDDGSEMRRRLEASFDRFVDARSLSDDRIADLIKSLEIDLLVDLKGFTQGARTGIFARRP